MIVDILMTIGLWLGYYFAVCLLCAGLGRLGSRWRPPPSGPASTEPGWSTALMVEVDDASGLIGPAVQLDGLELPGRAQLRLEVVDPAGRTHRAGTRTIDASHLRRHLSFIPLAPPAGVRPEDMVTWRWDVVLTHGRQEWRRTHWLQVGGGLNAEAELGPARL